MNIAQTIALGTGAGLIGGAAAGYGLTEAREPDAKGFDKASLYGSGGYAMVMTSITSTLGMWSLAEQTALMPAARGYGLQLLGSTAVVGGVVAGVLGGKLLADRTEAN